jgi:glycosyltransferase involved in cell wall biosynthesis
MVRPQIDCRTPGLMRVLTLTPFYPTASDDAAGCFVAEPIRVLEEFEVESPVIAVRPFYSERPAPNGHPARWLRYVAIPGGAGLASSGAFLYATLLTKVRRLHEFRPIDLIHAHAALPCGHAAMLLSRRLSIPFVVTVHGLDAFFDAQVRGYAGQWCRLVARTVYQEAARVICISTRVADVLKRGVADANLTVIHNGVDPSQFAFGKDDPDHPTILSIGNLIPTKGHELLLRAFAILHERYLIVSCDIIGDGPERSRLQRLATELNVPSRVRFLGRQTRKQVAASMQRCTIFALPSSYEGLGCVYLEAMSAGKPAIACRGQGIEDVIEHRHNGWLVAPADLQGTADALSSLLQDTSLQRRIGSEARKSILQRFTLQHQAERLAKLYWECAA